MSRRIRFGIIGVGGMGQGHCSSMQKVTEAKLTAVCDIDPDTAKKVGEQHGVPSFVNHKELIKSGLCDAVVIATPHPVRPPIAIDAMNGKLHVLSEKPLSERVSSADKMIRTAKKNNVTLGIMFQRRTEAVFRKAIEIVRNGQLGTVYRTALISPEYRSQAYYNSAGWRANWIGEGGGVMMNQSPHILDLFILLGGMPKTVFGRVETRLHKIEVEDLAEALLTYPDGGTGYMYCSTNEPGSGQMIEVYGDKGKLTVRDGALKLVLYEPGIAEFTRTNTAMWGAPKGTEQIVDLPAGEAGHHVILRNFARHLLLGEPLLSPGEEGLRSLELANAVWLSAELGKPVKLPLSRAAYDRFLAAKRKTSKGSLVKAAAKRETDPHHK